MGKLVPYLKIVCDHFAVAFEFNLHFWRGTNRLPQIEHPLCVIETVTIHLANDIAALGTQLREHVVVVNTRDSITFNLAIHEVRAELSTFVYFCRVT